MCVCVCVFTFGTGDLTSFSSGERWFACTYAQCVPDAAAESKTLELMHVSIRNDPVLHRAKTMTYLPQRELERRGEEGAGPRDGSDWEGGRDGGRMAEGCCKNREGCKETSWQPSVFLHFLFLFFPLHPIPPCTSQRDAQKTRNRSPAQTRILNRTLR